MPRRLSLVLLAIAAVGVVSAQPSVRRTTNLAALKAQPGFYHQRQVLVAGDVSRQSDGRVWLGDAELTLPIVFDGNLPDGLVEVRGTFGDLGRLNSDDPRLTPFDLRRTLGIDVAEGWPQPGEVLAIFASAVSPATPPASPSLRALVLHPSRYVDQTVTIVGQYGGRNLLGDLPASPANSRWDFVLRTTDAAVWVSNIRPRGRDFDLALDARFDTGRWLEVTGTLRQGRGLQWIDATTGRVALAKPVAEPSANEEFAAALPPAPPPEVVFSAPIQDETRVEAGSNVRVQFSRDLRAATLEGRVRAVYVDPEGADRVMETPIAGITTQYSAANRVLQIRFSPPLEPFRTVRVTLDEGITGTDGQPLAPWTLTFTTGN